ncbi:hypothetical protein [Candidatus Arthromitus sp. SFB-rat-Yit]|uniref:hypothetical protein n=1 Tax=Candidatus Arthromitus sp. SFB-rat-Yit TaxID=1041504 RepID=UPI0002DDB9D7|nr:hypothetical protein [Candidatus Arthromitus sp. SFB-rat-Yit]
MFFKEKKFKYIFGILLFICVFTVGFVKINVVYSSTGIVNNVREVQDNSNNDLSISTFDDKTLISIYKESYGYDVILRINGENKIFSIKFPWKR